MSSMKRRKFLRVTAVALLSIVLFTAAKGTFWQRDTYDTTEQNLELAKRSTPELIAFLKEMPKGADLHNHLSGATYAEYLLLSAQDSGKVYNTVTKLFEAPKTSSGDQVSIADLIANGALAQEFFNIYSMHGWYPNTTNGHDLFFNTFGYMWSAGRPQTAMLAEVIARNINQNIQHLELMTSCVPKPIIKSLAKKTDALITNNVKSTDTLFTYTAVYDSIENGSDESLEKFLELAYAPLLKSLETKDNIKQIKNYTNDSMMAPAKVILAKENGITHVDSLISVKFIYQLKRLDSNRNFFMNAVIAAYATTQNSDIVAINMVQAEDDIRSLVNFNRQMVILDFVYSKLKPTLALHAGELVLDGSPVEPMRNRISHTIKKGHASRIGHGISIAWEDSLPELLEYMVDSSIAVEICLSSNESILGVKGKDHPFIMYREAGVAVTLNTDDEGVSRSNITSEFVKAVQRYDLNYADLKELVRNSLEYSFLDGESLFKDYSKKIKNNIPKKSKDMSEKMKRQIQLENAFDIFEDGFKK
jgi:adenosine deaminase